MGGQRSKSAVQSHQIANHSNCLGRRNKGTPNQSISQDTYYIQCGEGYKMLLESKDSILFLFI